MRAILLAALAATPAMAETPMTGAEFQAHIGQNTISYLYSNGVRGTADYGPDRTLVWAFEGEGCFNARWYPDQDQICFAFEDGHLSACWRFTLEDDRLLGKATYLSSGSPLDLEIREVSHTDQEMSCPGPDVGV